MCDLLWVDMSEPTPLTALDFPVLQELCEQVFLDSNEDNVSGLVNFALAGEECLTAFLAACQRCTTLESHHDRCTVTFELKLSGNANARQVTGVPRTDVRFQFLLSVSAMYARSITVHLSECADHRCSVSSSCVIPFGNVTHAQDITIDGFFVGTYTDTFMGVIPSVLPLLPQIPVVKLEWEMFLYIGRIGVGVSFKSLTVVDCDSTLDGFFSFPGLLARELTVFMGFDEPGTLADMLPQTLTGGGMATLKTLSVFHYKCFDTDLGMNMVEFIQKFESCLPLLEQLTISAVAVADLEIVEGAVVPVVDVIYTRAIGLLQSLREYTGRRKIELKFTNDIDYTCVDTGGHHELDELVATHASQLTNALRGRFSKTTGASWIAQHESSNSTKVTIAMRLVDY